METITSLHSILKGWINVMNPNNVYQTLINKMNVLMLFNLCQAHKHVFSAHGTGAAVS